MVGSVEFGMIPGTCSGPPMPSRGRTCSPSTPPVTRGWPLTLLVADWPRAVCAFVRARCTDRGRHRPHPDGPQCWGHSCCRTNPPAVSVRNPYASSAPFSLAIRELGFPARYVEVCLAANDQIGAVGVTRREADNLLLHQDLGLFRRPGRVDPWVRLAKLANPIAKPIVVIGAAASLPIVIRFFHCGSRSRGTTWAAPRA